MGNALYVVKLSVPEDRRLEWESWYRNDHLKKVLAQPGFLGAEVCEVFSGDEAHTFWTVYRVESLEALQAYREGEASKKLQAEYREKFPDFSPASRVILHLT